MGRQETTGDVRHGVGQGTTMGQAVEGIEAFLP